MGKLHQLPGMRISPVNLIHEVLEEIDDAKAIAVVWLTDDGYFRFTWSACKKSEFLAMARALDARAARELFDESEESETVPGNG